MKEECVVPVEVRQLTEERVVVYASSAEPDLDQLLVKGESLLFFQTIKNVKVTRTTARNVEGGIELTMQLERLSRVNHYRWLNLLYSDSKYGMGDVHLMGVKFYNVWSCVFHNRKTARKNQEVMT